MIEIRKGLTISKDLFSEIENAVDITFEDEATRKKLKASIARGIGRIRSWSSDLALDVEDDDTARQLLIDYVRYDLNGMSDAFRENYAPDIASLRLRKEAAAVGEETTTDV